MEPTAGHVKRLIDFMSDPNVLRAMGQVTTGGILKMADEKWLPDWLREALSKPTMPIPLAGKALGIESRGGSYDAARRGEIPTLKLGRLRPVPTAWVRRQLMLDGDGEQKPAVRGD
jgi:hypothetical protein